MPAVVFADQPVTWNPSRVTQKLLPGTVASVEVGLTSQRSLTRVRVRVSRRLSRIVSTSPVSLDAVPAGETRTITILFTVPSGAGVQNLSGRISLVSQDEDDDADDNAKESEDENNDAERESSGHSLTVTVQVGRASIAEAPPSFALPSRDRIASEPDLGDFNFVRDEIEVVFNDGTAFSTIQEVVSSIGGVFLGSIPEFNLYQVIVPREGFDNLSELIRLVEIQHSVTFAIHHFLTKSLKIPHDPGTKLSYGPPLINLGAAWDLTTGTKIPRVGIVDTVFDFSHPDLVANIAKHTANSAPLSISHGTRVASIVGAKGDNDIGIAGVMWDASLYLYSASLPSNVRSMDPGGTIPEALKDGVRVINYSSGQECQQCTDKQTQSLNDTDKLFQYYIDRARMQGPDVLWVFSAGNAGTRLSNSSPARLSTVPSNKNVVSVAAVDSKAKLASFSDYGQGVTIAAPGVEIFSDTRGGGYDDGTSILEILSDDTATGTSFAAPYATGVAGLMLSVNPNLTASQLKTIIHDTAIHTGNFDPDSNEVLLLDAFRAVEQAQALSTRKLYAFVANGTGTSDNVWSYAVDPATGKLTPVINPLTGSPGFTSGGSLGSFSVATDPAGKFVYVANLGAFPLHGDVSAYAVNQDTGVLSPVAGTPFSAGFGPVFVVVDPKARFAYVANEILPGGISAYTINPSTGVLSTIIGSPFPFVAQSLAVDPAGRFLYGTGGSGGVDVFEINPSTGGLTLVPGSPFPADFGHSVAVDPTGKFVYVANIPGSVSAYTTNSTTGALTSIAGSPFPGALSAFSVAVDPSGKFVYVANANPSNSVSAYTIIPSTGALTPVAGSPFPTVGCAVSVTVDSSGKFVYVATTCGSNGISAYTLDPSTGALTPLVGSPFPAGGEPLSITVSGKTP
jgi:6-phosphogluconolactonase